jgi:hypothetical protein
MGKLFDELKTIKAEYDRKLQQEGEAAVKDAFKDLFDKYPEIRSVTWTQYTPYFNDGDTCTFSVHDFDVSLGTDETLRAEIDEKKRLTVEAANAGDYKKAQKLKDEVTRLQERLEDEDDDYSYGESKYTLRRSSNPREVEIAEAVSALEREMPDDVLESVFGDHSRIVATRDGFKVTEQEHD